MKSTHNTRSRSQVHTLRMLGLCLLISAVCGPSRADILSTSWVQGQVGQEFITANDGNPNFGLPTTFHAPIGSAAALSGDGSASTFSNAQYLASAGVFAPMKAFASAVGPSDDFGNQAQSTVYLDDLLTPIGSLPPGTAALMFGFEVDGTAMLVPQYSNDELTFGFTVQSLGPGGSLDNSFHKDVMGLTGGAFLFLGSETVTVTSGPTYFYEFLQTWARGDWCPGGGCTGTLDAHGTGGMISIEALDANGNPLDPVSLLGASGAVYGSTAVPEPSSLFPLASGVGLIWVRLRRRIRTRAG